MVNIHLYFRLTNLNLRFRVTECILKIGFQIFNYKKINIKIFKIKKNYSSHFLC